MNFLDIIILTFLAIFLLNGLRKGFFREVFGLVGVLGGLVAAIWGGEVLSRLLIQQFPGLPYFLIPVFSFVLLFLTVYLFSRFLANSLSTLTETIHLAWVNRLLGAGIGLLKGVVILSFLFVLLGLVPGVGNSRVLKNDSRLFTPIQEVVPSLYSMAGGWNFDTGKLEKKLNSILKEGQSTIRKQTAKYLIDNLNADSLATP